MCVIMIRFVEGVGGKRSLGGPVEKDAFCSFLTQVPLLKSRNVSLWKLIYRNQFF